MPCLVVGDSRVTTDQSEDSTNVIQPAQSNVEPKGAYSRVYNPEGQQTLWAKRIKIYEECSDALWMKNEIVGVVLISRLVEVALGHGKQICKC